MSSTTRPLWNTAAAPPELPQENGLPPGWQIVPHGDGHYYWHTTTGEVSWTHPSPAAAGPPPLPPPQPPVPSMAEFFPTPASSSMGKTEVIYPTAANGAASGGGGSVGTNGGGGSKPPPPVVATDAVLERRQHRLRATPFLARNMALISNATTMWVGFLILCTQTYRWGVDDTSSSNVPIELRSRVGWPAVLMCMGGGGAGFAFELWSCSFKDPSDKEVIPKKMWILRTAVYTAMAGLGFLISSALMPTLIVSFFYVITATTNAIACMAELPTQKKWQWKLIDRAKEKEKASLLGGKFLSSKQAIADWPRKFYVDSFEKGVVPRRTFLAVYSLLNLILFWEAFVRHANTEKGKALRGEPFLGCSCCEPTDLACGCVKPCAGGLESVPENEKLREVGAGVWYPWAKGFGQLLNLNCMFMLLPVVRSLVMWLHNQMSVRPPWYLAWFPRQLLDKNIVFHKACAKYFILVSVFGHATAHYLNYAAAPYYEAELGEVNYGRSPTRMAWDPGSQGASTGIAPGFTGEVLLMTMLVIFSGTARKPTRRRRHTQTQRTTGRVPLRFHRRSPPRPTAETVRLAPPLARRAHCPSDPGAAPPSPTYPPPIRTPHARQTPISHPSRQSRIPQSPPTSPSRTPPGAHEVVKRSHYETFWYSHHFFIIWFITLLFHGPVGAALRP